MKYIQFTLFGVNRYISDNDVKNIEKAVELGFRPAEDKNGNIIYKDLNPIDTSKSVDNDEVKNVLDKIAGQANKGNVQIPPVGTIEK